MDKDRFKGTLKVVAGKVIGSHLVGDLVKGTISEQQCIIEQLEHYITGQRG